MLLAYSRVSTIEQARSDRTSLEIQQQTIRGLALAKGYKESEIGWYTDEGVSGAVRVFERPQGHRLIMDMQRGDLVIASKLDRMFRSALDALLTIDRMKEAGVDLVLFDLGADPVTGDGIAKAFFTMLAAFAELERSRITERMIEGRRGKKERGGHVGGRAPYGYRIEGSGRESKLVEWEEEREIVKVVADMRLRYGPASIARALEQQGLRTRTGRPFHHVQVRRIMNYLEKAS